MINKSKFYYSDGTTSSKRDWSKVLHRENCPAVECSDGYKAWLINGKRHRENGPAIEFSNGTNRYYLNGIYFSTKNSYEEAVLKLKKYEIHCSYINYNEERMVCKSNFFYVPTLREISIFKNTSIKYNSKNYAEEIIKLLKFQHNFLYFWIVKV